MSATSAGALKSLIEGAGLGLSAFRDSAPEDQVYPYCTIAEAIDLVPDQSGDNGIAPTVTESVQVDLWQQYRNPTTRAITESYTLPDALLAALHGARLDQHPKKCYGVLVRSMIRLPDKDTNVIRHTLDVDLRRTI